MSYSLHTLHNPTDSNRSEPPSGIRRFAHEIALVLGFVALVFWCLALLTHSAQDAAFSTSGSGGATRNWGGRLGALLADASYFLMGFSVWWCVAAGIRSWFTSLAQWMRAEEEAPAPERTLRDRLVFWGGLFLLVASSAALEWSRMYRFEPRLPDHAGGAMGYLFGPAAVKWLGFTGSGLVAITGVVVAMAAVFRVWAGEGRRVPAGGGGVNHSSDPPERCPSKMRPLPVISSLDQPTGWGPSFSSNERALLLRFSIACCAFPRCEP